MIISYPPHSPILATLSALALLLLLLALAASIAAAQSDSDSAYVIRANLPAAVVHDLSIRIIIPAGMIFDASSLQASWAASAPAVSVGSPNDGTAETMVDVAHGDVDNSQNQDLLLTFRSLVADVASVENGATLPPIRAELQYRLVDGELKTFSGEMEAVTVIEPDLALERSFSPATALAGGEIECTLRISHTSPSTAPAYDVSIQDNLPAGLEYVPGSLEIISGPPGLAQAASLGASFSEIDGSWSGEQKVELSYTARIAEDAHDNLTCRAGLTWTSTAGENPAERTYHQSAEGLLLLSAPAPDLQISLSDSPDPLAPGGTLSYIISYENRGGPATGVSVQAAWDPSLAFLSATPAPDQGSENTWTIGDLPSNASGSIEVTLQAPADAAEGLVLSGSARIAAASSQAAAYATTTIQSAPSRLFIEKSAAEDIIHPGGSINYTITYGSDGQSPASNVSITDIIDPHLAFSPESCTPAPSRIWSDGEGTHLLWNATALSAALLSPGEGGSIAFAAGLSAHPAHPDFDWVYNRYRIDSDSSSGAFRSLSTPVVHSLWVRKKADREMYMRSETVNYTITYGNDLAIDADDARLTDILPDVEFLDADPKPNFNNGSVLVWNLGTLPPNSSGTIQLYARINKSRTDIIFQDQQSVSGEGYMQRHQDLSTARQPKSLTNYVDITARYLDLPDSDQSSATIGLLDALGTEVELRGHGSGSYAREEETLLKTNNSTISLSTSLSARYRPSSFSLPGGRQIGYTSKWHDSQASKNRITDSSTTESYSYASRLDRSCTLHLDKNGSTLESETTFEGAGSIGLLKGAAKNTTTFSARDPAYESREDYLGSFTVYTRYDEYGKSAAASRSASGTGFASSDRRVSDRQRSYEHGTGSYSVEDEIQTQTNYMAKEINATHAPTSFSYTPRVQVNLSSKFNEGMWSRSGRPPAKGSNSSTPASFISEEFDQLDYLQKSGVASGLNQMKTEADFQGRARFTAQYQNLSGNSSDQLDLYDEYLGRYSITRDVEMGGVASFDQPHLSISKSGSQEPAGGTFIDYVIAVKNDGNRALGPVYVQDLFPPGTEYIGSSLRPSDSTAASCQWTLQSLGIGQSSTIELKLNSTTEQPGLVNRVLASGGYDGQWVKAENYSALQYSWLECCSSQLLAAKTGKVNSSDPTLIRYSIRLKNRENYTLAVTIRDELPEGISFVNSTLPPAGRTASSLTWNIVDLQPGQVRTLDYLARAHRSGTFSAPAYIDASSLDGSEVLSADVSAQVYVPGELSSSISSDWQPPACFDLNCTTQGSQENWIPCTACSAAGLEDIEIECSSCGQVEE